MRIHQKYMQALSYMNKTMKADNAAGHQWRYCNNSRKKAKGFQQARKQGKYLINCVDGPQWACKLAGIPGNALSWYGHGGIVWCNKNAQKYARKYFDIIKVGKTVQKCYNQGLLCQGDILLYQNMAHTNAYYKNGKSFDSGHAYCTGSGEGAAHKKWIGNLACKGSTVAYIFRIKDRTHYRVQAGAFTDEAKAKEQVELINSKGFKTLVFNEDDMIKIQCGLFDGKENAEKLVQKLAQKGIASFIKEL